MPTSTQTAASTNTLPQTWSRIVITSVQPVIEEGRWPLKRAVGESVDVTAGVIVDGHEVLDVELCYRHEQADEPHRVQMEAVGNDDYKASFSVATLGRYEYWVEAHLDRFATWQDQFRRRIKGGEPEKELKSELSEGTDLLRRAHKNASGDDKKLLAAHLEAFENDDFDAALHTDVAELVRKNAPRDMLVSSDAYEILVDPELARCAAWYEFFPRSTSDAPGTHATLDDAAERLPRIKEMGYDIVYLPPVHPIGETNRKGKDNAPTAEPGEPGSPWAIGGDNGDGTAGGHKSVHPDLGGLDAFDRFVEKAHEVGLEVSIDIAFQTSPDHPYVKEHPEWFYHRPDGSIRYAENPPKKYQDVYPINFENEDWQALWHELKSVFEFWIDRGVTIFRVDNPHTKSFTFWEWCLRELRKDTPELIVLSEAFTKPKTMYTLAKLGFNNSYTYFTWRNTRQELESYAQELFQTEVAEFFRPNFWPNTPDILHDFLVHGGRPAHKLRFVLAATLSSAYGIYGPPYEHVDNNQHPKREEYANNEKYEVRTWNWNDPNSLQPFMQRVNEIRKANPALQQMRNIRFHETMNNDLIAYSKWKGDNLILVVANLDPHNGHAGQVVLPLEEMGLPADDSFPVHDLLNDQRHMWRGTHNYVHLDPHVAPAHVFHVQGSMPHEQQHPTYDQVVHH